MPQRRERACHSVRLLRSSSTFTSARPLLNLFPIVLFPIVVAKYRRATSQIRQPFAETDLQACIDELLGTGETREPSPSNGDSLSKDAPCPPILAP